MKRVFGYIGEYKWRLTGGIAMKTAGTLAELVLPLILAYMIDTVAPTRSVAALVWWGVAMVGVSVAAYLGNVFANRNASRIGRDVTERLRGDLFTKTLSLSFRQADEVTMPSLVSRLSSDTYNVHTMLVMTQRMGIRAPLMLIGGVAMTFTLDPVLALVLLAVVPFLTVFVVFVSSRGVKLYTALQRAVDGMVRKVRDDHTGIRVIKALSKTQYESDSFRALNETVSLRERKAGVTMDITNPVLNFFLNLGMTAVIFVGAYRVAGGHSGVGELIAFTSYFSIILNAVIAVSRIFVMLTKGTASAARIEEVLDLPADLLPVPCEAEEDEAFIRFENVSFSYGGAPVLEDVSFSVKKGETLGIIGGTGSGKSTLVSLLLRFYDADGGRVLVGGKDVRGYEPSALRKKFGVVFQSDFLMAATVRENIDFERNVPPENIPKAAECACAEGFVSALEEGYESRLAVRGANFSGGQKQRLLIARALAGDPEILVLDDSSSALDYKTDALVRQAISKQYPNTTVLMVAQRISSVRGADKILVLDGGRAAGFGSDEQLMQTCEAYRRIYESQKGAENE